MKKRVLIIEDNEDIRTMYSQALVSAGYECEYHSDGLNVMDHIIEYSPSVILLDIMMPRIDGFAVLQQLKGNANTNTIPVIVMTNLSGDDVKKKVIDLGGEEMFVKSEVRPRQVIEFIDRMFTSANN